MSGIDPTTIDWPARQARALVPYRVVDGVPINPCEQTGRTGGLRHWGERACADAIIAATIGGCRHLLMIERGDGHGWALPGGGADPGETAAQAAVRELAEETGLAVPADAPRQVLPARYVPDPRATDNAWYCTTPVKFDLGELADTDSLPTVKGSDDAQRAAWVHADDYDTLTSYLGAVYSGQVFPAHQAMLSALLG